MAVGDVFFPFNAVAIGVAPNVTYDRSFDAADFAAYFASFVGTGVYPNPSTNYKVNSLNNNLTLTVTTGMAFINGYYAHMTQNTTMTVAAPDTVYRRIDSVILRLDLVNRGFALMCVKGTPAGSPVAPVLVRNSDNYDIRLAEVSVRAGTVSILTSDITDTRQNNSVCGFVQGLITQVDTTDIYNQYQTYLNAQVTAWNTLWNTTKNNQDAAWNAQMAQEANDYANWKATLEAWKDLTVTQLATAVQFVFDNEAAYPGTYKTFDDSVTDQIIEEIHYTSGGALFARRTTVFNADGSITITELVYYPGATTIFRNVRVTITFPSGKPRTEVVQL